MNILFITTSHNSMSQRMYVELTEQGQTVDIHITSTADNMREAVRLSNPDVIICPFLKTAIPTDIWQNHLCIIVHPGVKGDRGPSSIDWAIVNEETEWGVTLLQADEEMDAGDIWSSNNYPMRPVSKSTLYRHEATQVAVKGLYDLLDKLAKDNFKPEPLNYNDVEVKGQLLPIMKQAMRSINWLEDDSETIARKIRAADSNPGVLDTTVFGESYYLFGCHVEDTLTGDIGAILAYRDDAVCIGTVNGSVWISHVKKKGYFKLPATMALKHLLTDVPHLPLSPFEAVTGRTYREIYYTEENYVGYLHFDFYNGAMHTTHCKNLQQAIAVAKTKDTKTLVLMGGHDFWSNGIHLNTIEHADDPAFESWENINAIDDVVLEILNTHDKLVISAMQGNAGAGGVILALAADFVFARNGVVLNPHYKNMGDLYGSEYWTYLLPKRVGQEKAHQITNECLPMGTFEAISLGLIEDCFGENIDTFKQRMKEEVERLSHSVFYGQLLIDKNNDRKKDEAIKPLAAYRHEELEEMKRNFFGEDQSYHTARKNFVYKVSCEDKGILINVSKQLL